jgi:hypothetical protein
VIAGVGTQGGERPLHIERCSLGDDTLGLLDDDAAVESMAGAAGSGPGPRARPGAGEWRWWLRRPEPGRYRHPPVGISPESSVEQVEGADDRAPQAHRQGLDRTEASRERLSGETGPAAGGRGEVCLHDRLRRSGSSPGTALLWPAARTARVPAWPRWRKPLPSAHRRARPT